MTLTVSKYIVFMTTLTVVTMLLSYIAATKVAAYEQSGFVDFWLGMFSIMTIIAAVVSAVITVCAAVREMGEKK